MNRKIPVKSLTQVNIVMTIVSGGFLSILIFAYGGLKPEAIYIVTNAVVSMIVISFLHIRTAVWLYKYRRRWSVEKRRLHLYIITYIAALAYSFMTIPVRNFLADSSWEVISLRHRVIIIIISGIGLNTLIIIIHSLVNSYQVRNEAEIENAQLRVANSEANNQLLRQQIHPHFLFNALNIVKSLYKTDVNAGDAYIVHLANFLRASITNSSAKVVSLHDEITICTDYIAMQKIRFGDALNCNISIPADKSKAGYMPSFSLQPLLENAIKHNTVTDERPLTIDIYTEEKYVVVRNNLQKKNGMVSSTGNGLLNLTKRYQLLSGDEVTIWQNEAHFFVRLSILQL